MLASVRSAELDKAKAQLSGMQEDLSNAVAALSEQNGQGSVQERAALDRAIASQAAAADKLSTLQVPPQLLPFLAQLESDVHH